VVDELGGEDVDRHEYAETVAGAAASLLTFENAALPLLVILPTRRIAMANRAVRTLLGYGFDLIGQHVFDVVEGDRRTLDQVWEERMASREQVTPERRVELRRADGTRVTVRAASTLVTDASGAVRYIVARVSADRPRE
jgi:PAS domain S-box-containing protein